MYAYTIYREEITRNGKYLLVIEFDIIIRPVVYCDMMTEKSSDDR